MTYLARVVDGELVRALAAAGIVLLEGPRGCGKTSTALQAAASSVLLDRDEGDRALAALAPEQVLRGAQPRLIDEWQLAPALWNEARAMVDALGAPKGQFIFAGSSLPADDVTRHTGALRVQRLRMRPMSLAESGGSSGEVSLASVLSGARPALSGRRSDLATLTDLVVRGGWPGLLGIEADAAQGVLRSAVEDIARIDVPAVAEARRNPEAVLRVMRSLARNSATLVSDATIAADCSGSQRPLAPATVAAYDAALTRLMVVEDQPAWMPDLRSRARIRNSAKRHYVDPSLACAVLAISSARLMRDLRFLGLLFESLVVRDLRVYAQSLQGRVLHYRDSTDLEVDIIIECADGRIGAFEVKLGHQQIDSAAATLIRLAQKLAPTSMAKDIILGVITHTGPSYQRADGVYVLAIDALGP